MVNMEKLRAAGAALEQKMKKPAGLVAAEDRVRKLREERVLIEQRLQAEAARQRELGSNSESTEYRAIKAELDKFDAFDAPLKVARRELQEQQRLFVGVFNGLMRDHSNALAPEIGELVEALAEIHSQFSRAENFTLNSAGSEIASVNCYSVGLHSHRLLLQSMIKPAAAS